MANRVNVNVNVSDHSRAGLAALRQNMNRMQRDVRRAGGTINFRVDVDPGTSRRDLRRIQRSLRGMPVTINTRLDPPTPGPVTLRRRILRGLGGAVRIPVRVTTRGLTAGVRGPLRALGGLVGGIMQDGVGQGIINGLKAGGPVGAAILAAAIVTALAVVGAALSGLIITALGAAFVGIGAVSAFQSKKVQAQWSDTLDIIKEQFKSVGEPLIPVLDRALERLGTMAEAAGPELQKALEATAPATEKFINGIMDGLESFGKAAFGPIMDAWNVFAPVFGEEWDEFMDELGNSFADMADLVKEHPTEIAAALDVVFEAIDLLVDTVTFFGKTWVFIMQTVGDSIGVILKIFAGLLDGALAAFEGILFAADWAFGWIPGLGDKLSTAKEGFSNFRDTTVGKLNDMADAAFGWDEALNDANRKRRLEADISSWSSKLSTAREQLKKTTSQKAKAKLEANIKDLQDKIATAREQLNALNGKTSTTYVNTVYTSTSQGGHPTQRRRAMGGIIGTAQSGGIRSNMTLVGEAGPEIVQLPPGSRVRSNPDTRRMVNQASQPGAAGRVFIDAAGDDVSQLLLRILRHAIRDQGGDVQVVLGRG